MVMAGTAFLLHAGLLLLLIMLIAGQPVFLFFVCLLLIKMISEFLFLYRLTDFFRKRKLLWILIPAQLIYMIYIVVIGAAAPFGSYRWKGRTIRPQASQAPVS